MTFRRALGVAAPLLCGLILACGGESNAVAWVFVSDPVPLCDPGDSSLPCDEFAGGRVLEELGDAPAASLDVESLEDRTGVRWRRVRVSEPLFIDLAALHGPEAMETATYVVEVVETEEPSERLLSLASNAGAAVWVEGSFRMRSRYARRGTNRYSDLMRVALEPGANAVVYRVLSGGGEWRLYREWWSPERTLEVLSPTIEEGAFADLPTTVLLDDTATTVTLKPPSVVLGSTPEIRFRWTGLLGDSLWSSPAQIGAYPLRLSLPPGWTGAAVLETEVTDPVTGRRLHAEALPLFADSTARRLASDLVARPAPPGDAVHAARVRAVRRLFGLDGDPSEGAPGLQVRALADLYRIVYDPTGYPWYSGPQVWGYEAGGESVPFWLMVPPGLDPTRPILQPLAFAVYHLTDPDFWRGRGAYSGQVIHQATLSSSIGGFAVIPHLGGVHEFGRLGAEELPAILRAVSAALPVDTSRIGLLVWSQHATSALDLALEPDLPLSHLDLAVPALAPEGLDPVLFALARLRPNLRVRLWSGELDDVVPPAFVEGLAEIFRGQGLTTEHVVVPHSTHLGGLLYDVQAELRRDLVTAAPEAESAAESSTPSRRPGR